MQILLTRKNNLATMFWKYRLVLEDQEYMLKNTESISVNVKNNSLRLEVSYHNNYKQVFEINDLSGCREIIIGNRVTNFQAIGCTVLSFASLALFLITGNGLFIWVWILILSVLRIISFDLCRNRFFRIRCVEK